MLYEEFQDWLRARGVSSQAISTRASTVRGIEHVMEAMGSSQTELDAEFTHDRFAHLSQALAEMRKDAQNGGDQYRLLFPDSVKPLNRLANARNWLRQYGNFIDTAGDDKGVALDPAENYWLVGASFGGNDDQVDRFLRDGIWEIQTPKATEAAAVRSMRIGDRIAIKSVFVQLRNLPFDNQDKTVSVMRVKARGVITENDDSGERIRVSWDEDFEPRDWYFHTYRATIWRVRATGEIPEKLIAFAFFDEAQDISWFRTHNESLASQSDEADKSARRFWIEKTIVTGRPDREVGDHAFGRALWSPQRSINGSNIYANMLEVKPGDVIFHLKDNEEISCVSIARGIAETDFVGPEGTDWAGQPAYRIELSDLQLLVPALPRSAFLETEPFASELRELAGSGARGLFFNIRGTLNQGKYLTEMTPTLLSILSRSYRQYAGKSLPHTLSDESSEATEVVKAYTLDDALLTLFINRGDVEELLLLWRAKKNIILQGPPGVGKSFAAQKLAFTLMGKEDRTRLGFVQFHQSYSYEDFVEGFRPTANGFELRQGKFVEFCRRAEADPNETYVFLIDEINRGNLSKILGELMLLVESDKRDPDWAMPLSSGKAPFHVPPNVFVMGMMNTADRSLAVVDYALRRRFAFVDLPPGLGSPKFREQLVGAGISETLVTLIIDRIGLLNQEIIADTANLGSGFAIGHSFFCSKPTASETDDAWYTRIIRTEIVPLLREYWFDHQSKADDWRDKLLAAA